MAPLGATLIYDGARGVHRRRQGRRLRPRAAGLLAARGRAQTDPTSTVAFTARSRAEVDAFHAAALAAGGQRQWRAGPAAALPSRTITAPSSSTPTATMSKPSATSRNRAEHDEPRQQASYSGGCQCGAVRFRVEGALGDASICHCRMCQKASGNFYLPLVSVRGAKLDLDARRAEEVPLVEPCAPRLLRRLRHAADLSRRRTAWRSRSAPSTTRRRSRRRSSGASRRSCPMSTRSPRLPGEETMADIATQPLPRRPRLLPASRPRHRPMAA